MEDCLTSSIVPGSPPFEEDDEDDDDYEVVTAGNSSRRSEVTAAAAGPSKPSAYRPICPRLPTNLGKMRTEDDEIQPAADVSDEADNIFVNAKNSADGRGIAAPPPCETKSAGAEVKPFEEYVQPAIEIAGAEPPTDGNDVKGQTSPSVKNYES